MATQNMIERAYSATPTANLIPTWDANSNLSADNFLSGYTTTATAASTTTLSVDSKYWNFFTGSTTQTVVLPVTSTLVLGQTYFIVNTSSGVVTVQSSGGNTVQAMAANTSAIITCISTSGTGAASWSVIYYFNGGGSGTVSAGTAGQLAYYAANGTTISGGQLGNVAGTTTNDNAAAGNVGEYISSSVLAGAAVPLTVSGTTYNITSISLTAGDWDVTATGWSNPAAGTISQSFFAAISTTSATLPTAGAENNMAGFGNDTPAANAFFGVGVGPMRLSLSGTTTVYLVANSVFSVSTISAYGFISARRVR